jgi:predicted porin
MFLAKYTTGPLKVYFGYEAIQFAPPSDPQTSFTDIAGFGISGFAASTASPNGGITAINNIAYTPACGTGVCSDKMLQVWWTGAKYAVQDNLDVIGAYYHYSQNTFTTASCVNPVAHSQCSGSMDAVSGVVDWRFAPKWDTYIGVMFSQMNGGLDNGFLVRNDIATTSGVRFRF